MKSRENLLRLKHFQVQEKTRQLAQIDMMLAEFERMSGDLLAQIDVEEKKAGISDINHFAYPTFAKAARQRVDNLAISVRDLQEKRQNAEEALLEAEENLKKAEAKDARDNGGTVEGGTVEQMDQVVDSQVESRMLIG